MSIQTAITDATDTVAMVNYYGGDVQGQFLIELQRIEYSYNMDESLVFSCKKKILNLLKNKYDINLEI